jgi:hypothetical protein
MLSNKNIHFVDEYKHKSIFMILIQTILFYILIGLIICFFTIYFDKLQLDISPFPKKTYY